MVFLRVFGYFISANVLMAISIDRSEDLLKNHYKKFQKIFCDRLPDLPPNLCAPNPVDSPRCLDTRSRLLCSTVKLISINNTFKF